LSNGNFVKYGVNVMKFIYCVVIRYYLMINITI